MLAVIPYLLRNLTRRRARGSLLKSRKGKLRRI